MCYASFLLSNPRFWSGRETISTTEKEPQSAQIPSSCSGSSSHSEPHVSHLPAQVPATPEPLTEAQPAAFTASILRNSYSLMKSRGQCALLPRHHPSWSPSCPRCRWHGVTVSWFPSSNVA